MEPLYFGSSQRPLYGVYHPAEGSEFRNEAIVFCCPFGQEYMRSHRAYRQLAHSLAKAGFHILRFDYSGTGDSSGDMEDFTALDWLEDIEQAINEIKDMTGTVNISLIGLRLGGLLAGMLSSRQKIHRLVLWDSINSGVDYIKELKFEIVSKKNIADLDVDNYVDDEGSMFFNGFSFTPRFLKSIEQLSLFENPLCSDALLQVVSHENQKSDQLKSKLIQHGNFDYIHAACPGDWNYVDEVGGMLLPQPVMRAIVNWLS